MDKIKGKLIFDYDEESDVLYSFINKPRYAIGMDLDEGITLRVDPKKKKIVGFTIVDFKYKIKNKLFNKIPHFEDVNLNSILKKA